MPLEETEIDKSSLWVQTRAQQLHDLPPDQVPALAKRLAKYLYDTTPATAVNILDLADKILLHAYMCYAYYVERKSVNPAKGVPEFSENPKAEAWLREQPDCAKSFVYVQLSDIGQDRHEYENELASLKEDLKSNPAVAKFQTNLVPQISTHLRQLDDHYHQVLRIFLEGHGIGIAQCIRAFASPEDNPHVVAARDRTEDGELEVDDYTVASGSGDNGDYVLAWVWVSDEEAGIISEDDLEDYRVSLTEELKVASGEEVTNVQLTIEKDESVKILCRLNCQGELYDIEYDFDVENDTSCSHVRRSAGGSTLETTNEPLVCLKTAEAVTTFAAVNTSNQHFAGIERSAVVTADDVEEDSPHLAAVLCLHEKANHFCETL